jgi:hypothetical protein
LQGLIHVSFSVDLLSPLSLLLSAALLSVFSYTSPISRLHFAMVGMIPQGICRIACAVAAETDKKAARLPFVIPAVLSFHFASFFQALLPKPSATLSRWSWSSSFSASSSSPLSLKHCRSVR